MMDWIKIVKGIAPTVASALGGPLAGGIVATIGAALGVDRPTIETVGDAFRDGKLTADHVAMLQRLELELQDAEKERGFKYADLEFRDREGARRREVETRDGMNKALALVIVFAFIATTCGVLLGWAAVDGAMAGALVGYMSAKAEQVLSYYFGSTLSSARKTEIIAQAGPVQS